MKLTILAVLMVAVLYVNCEHLVIGNVADRVVLEHQERIQYSAYPFVKRVKQYFYTSPHGRRISGIQALDILHSKASINITAGGVGHSFVNMRMKSERGYGLDYDVGIYTSSEFQ